ncbi:MAG: class I SAM-dependent methyltransferase [Lachnospiraceae bacterium]|jgi:ubiquinone/menaquinone biosynthesis C-methylase UbiE|nr:class I SAM-dependent methyltransferase [Lachnospiraceae bacterium]
MREYWKEYWNEISIDTDEQSQVGRTISKVPVSADVFAETVIWVTERMKINEDSHILELCCGNGNWTLPLSNMVRSITAIDFSEPLIKVLKQRCASENKMNIDVKLQDIATIDSMNYTKINHVFLYAAIQYFSEKETILLFEKAYNILKTSCDEAAGNKNGVFYLGDIPDRQRLWNFANTKDYTKMYFDSVKNETPAIGTWFMQANLKKLAEYTGFSACEIIEQPDWQINNKYRFDMRMEV